METQETFALYLPVGLYVILTELVVLGMSFGFLKSLRGQPLGVIWEMGFLALGAISITPLFSLLPSAVAGFGLIAGMLALLFPFGMLWQRYAAWASSYSLWEDIEHE